MVQEMHQGSWDDQWVLQPFCYKSLKRLEPTVVQLLLFLPCRMMQLPLHQLPQCQLELHHSLVDKTSCQPYAQPRAALKQQLKESTKEIRKEAGATQILILVGDMSPELARVDACQQTLAMWLHARLSISFLPGSPQISSHEQSPRLNDGWPGLAHCSPCSWVRLQHSCFRKGCGWAAAEIVLIFFKSRRWAMRMHTPKALKSTSLRLFEKSRLLGHQSDCLESQGQHVRECYVRKCCKERQMWIQSRHQVQRFPCWIRRQSQFHVPKSLWVFYLLRPLAKSEFSWPCGLSWSNVPPLPFYPWCGEQILEPNPIDTGAK